MSATRQLGIRSVIDQKGRDDQAPNKSLNISKDGFEILVSSVNVVARNCQADACYHF